MFPRSAIGVEWFERELAAYRALAKTELSIVPRLLGGTSQAGKAGPFWRSVPCEGHSVEVELVALDILHHQARLVVVIGRQ